MPRFRTGTKVALNVYDGDRPIFQAHSAESAAELVELLNLGHHADALLEAYGGSVDRDRLARAMGLTSPETPSDRHESEPEGSGPQGGPETAEDATDGAEGWCQLRCGFCGHWDRGQFKKDQIAEWLRVHRNASISPNPDRLVSASVCPHPCGSDQ